jgi:hypothetical protein
MFVTAFTTAPHLSLSWATSIQSVLPHPTSWRSILILSSFYAWVSLVVTFPQVSPPKPCTHLPIRATCPAHLIPICLITRTILGEKYRSWSSSLWSYLYTPVTSSLLGPNILLNTLFSNTLSLRLKYIAVKKIGKKEREKERKKERTIARTPINAAIKVLVVGHKISEAYCHMPVTHILHWIKQITQ